VVRVLFAVAVAQLVEERADERFAFGVVEPSRLDGDLLGAQKPSRSLGVPAETSGFGGV